MTLHELSGVNDGQVLMEEVSKDQESDLCNNNPTAGANLHMFQHDSVENRSPIDLLRLSV